MGGTQASKAIEVTDLVVAFGSVTVLDHLTLDVNVGEVRKKEEV